MSLVPSARDGSMYDNSLSDRSRTDWSSPWSCERESSANVLTGEPEDELCGEDAVDRGVEDRPKRSFGVYGGVRRMEAGRDGIALRARGESKRLGVCGGVPYAMVVDMSMKSALGMKASAEESVSFQLCV